MKIHIVESNKDFKEELKLFLESVLKCKVVAESFNGTEFLNKLWVKCDVVLMGNNMLNFNGFELTKVGISINKNLKIIAISEYDKKINIQELVESGFKAYVSKKEITKNLEFVLNRVMKNKYHFPDSLRINNKQKKRP